MRNRIMVNVHGLLSQAECVALELYEDEVMEGGQFVFDKVSYQVIRRIDKDVERPIIYVMVLDILV
ncbi:hypothetical protein WDW89_08045 [Deltaproteobacteria bacterium TL4]